MAFRVVTFARPKHGSLKPISILQSRPYSIPAYVQHQHYPLVTNFPSGLRVTTSSSISDVATIAVFVEAGSAFESDHNNGVANFLQKVALKGSSKDKSPLQVAESHGISLTGFTDRENSGFIAQSHKDDVPKAFEILSSIILNHNFKESDIEKTRQILSKKQASLKDKWNEEILLDHLHAAAYQGTSYARTPLGESEAIKSIKKSDLVDFATKHYAAPQIVVVGTGAVNHDQITNLARDHLKNLPTTRTPLPSVVDFVGCEIRIDDDDAHQVKAAFSFEAVPRSHKDYWTFLLLRAMVGNFDYRNTADYFRCSALVEKVAKENLALKFNTHYHPYSNTGLFGLYVNSPDGVTDDAIYESFNVFQTLATYIPPIDLIRTKNQVKFELLSQFQDTKQAAYNTGKFLLSSGRPLSLAEQYQRIDDVSVDDIVKTISTYLTDVDPAVVAHGSVDEFPDYNVLRGWTYWNRW